MGIKRTLISDVSVFVSSMAANTELITGKHVNNPVYIYIYTVYIFIYIFVLCWMHPVHNMHSNAMKTVVFQPFVRSPLFELK